MKKILFLTLIVVMLFYSCNKYVAEIHTTACENPGKSVSYEKGRDLDRVQVQEEVRERRLRTPEVRGRQGVAEQRPPDVARQVPQVVEETRIFFSQPFHDGRSPQTAR